MDKKPGDEIQRIPVADPQPGAPLLSGKTTSFRAGTIPPHTQMEMMADIFPCRSNGTIFSTGEVGQSTLNLHLAPEIILVVVTPSLRRRISAFEPEMIKETWHFFLC
jgi:hypothetical protein